MDEADVTDAVETVSLATVVATPALDRISDAELWAFRNELRRALVQYVRRRLEQQVREQGMSDKFAARARQALDPEALTIGFARRFATYKRPHLLLQDMDRLIRLLHHIERPVQIIVAGKAHPSDDGGKELVRKVVQASLRPELFGRLIFLADYDIMMTSELVAGVDVWLNNPRRPMEASGTSGMKVLVNGGLNLSELDGWWAEAYSPEVGWALGDGREHEEPKWDDAEASQLYALLEKEVVPDFYGRDAQGLPAAWLRRVRASMTQLTPRFDSPRMLREYVEQFYLPAAKGYQARAANGGQQAKALDAWQTQLGQAWDDLRLEDRQATRQDGQWNVTVRVPLNGLNPDAVRLELYADGVNGQEATRVPMTRDGGGPDYHAQVPADRPVQDYTPRLTPFHPDALLPQEVPQIAWLDAPVKAQTRTFLAARQTPTALFPRSSVTESSRSGRMQSAEERREANP